MPGTIGSRLSNCSRLLAPAIEAFQSQHAATMRMLAANFQVVKASLEAPLRAVLELPKFELPIVSLPQFELPAATVAQLAQINGSIPSFDGSLEGFGWLPIDSPI